MNFIKNIFKPKKENPLDEVSNSISEGVLNSAFDIYEYIYSLPQTEKTGFEKDNLSNMKKVWEALQNLQKSNGDFSKISNEELNILREGFVYYDDMVRILIDHHNDENLANYIFEKHPELHSLIPKQYDNNLQVIEVIIEYVRAYQWNLENFVNLNLNNSSSID